MVSTIAKWGRSENIMWQEISLSYGNDFVSVCWRRIESYLACHSMDAASAVSTWQTSFLIRTKNHGCELHRNSFSTFQHYHVAAAAVMYSALKTIMHVCPIFTQWDPFLRWTFAKMFILAYSRVSNKFMDGISLLRGQIPNLHNYFDYHVCLSIRPVYVHHKNLFFT